MELSFSNVNLNAEVSAAVPADTTTRCAITLAGMRFHARVGVLPHERELPQPLEVDLTVHLVAESDEVLDYRRLYALTREIVDQEPLDYLEAIGGELAARAAANMGLKVVNGFTGSSIWHLLYSFPPVDPIHGGLCPCDVIARKWPRGQSTRTNIRWLSAGLLGFRTLWML